MRRHKAEQLKTAKIPKPNNINKRSASLECDEPTLYCVPESVQVKSALCDSNSGVRSYLLPLIFACVKGEVPQSKWDEKDGKKEHKKREEGQREDERKRKKKDKERKRERKKERTKEREREREREREQMLQRKHTHKKKKPYRTAGRGSTNSECVQRHSRQYNEKAHP